MSGVKADDLKNHEQDINDDSLETFITRDGTEGMLQIVGYLGDPDKPTGVKVRYKLVQANPADSSSGAADQSASGDSNWFLAGNHPEDYVMSTDANVTYNGKSSASLKSIVSGPEGFGTLMQTVKADAYRGKRIRLSGYVRSENLNDWAGLWMRVDGSILPGSKIPEPLAFDNMQKRPIKGTSDWAKYEIVLDVPERAQEIAFGILLSGQGQVWLDDVQFEIVGKDTATTAVMAVSPAPASSETSAQPINLNFEE
jgi:hypothetical protein